MIVYDNKLISIYLYFTCKFPIVPYLPNDVLYIISHIGFYKQYYLEYNVMVNGNKYFRNLYFYFLRWRRKFKSIVAKYKIGHFSGWTNCTWVFCHNILSINCY